MIRPFHHQIRQPIQGLGMWESTNLDLSENREGQTYGLAAGSVRSKGKQRAHSEKSTRLDEDGGDSLVQSTDSGLRPRSSANVPAMQDEPGDNNKGQGDVEQNRDRKE